MTVIDVILLAFFMVATAFCFYFSYNKKYFEKTVAAQGEEATVRLFRWIKIGGYVLGAVSATYFVLVLAGA